MEEEYMKLLKDMAKDICQIKEKLIVSNDTNSLNDLKDIEYICNKLKISKKTLRNYRSKGLIPFHKIGGKLFFIESEVQSALKNHYYGS